jgi:hypothetical protein
MSSVNASSSVLPETTVSSTGGFTAQYESQGVTPKIGGKSRRRRGLKKGRKSRRRRTNKRVSFMTKWMA